jgi:hypothetical protein
MLDNLLQAQRKMLINFLPNITEVSQTTSIINHYSIVFVETNVHSERVEKQRKKLKSILKIWR